MCIYLLWESSPSYVWKYFHDGIDGKDICLLIIITKLSGQYILTSCGRKTVWHGNFGGDQHVPPSQTRSTDRNVWKRNQQCHCSSLVLFYNTRAEKAKAHLCSDLHDLSQWRTSAIVQLINRYAEQFWKYRARHLREGSSKSDTVSGILFTSSRWQEEEQLPSPGPWKEHIPRSVIVKRQFCLLQILDWVW